MQPCNQFFSPQLFSCCFLQLSACKCFTVWLLQHDYPAVCWCISFKTSPIYAIRLNPRWYLVVCSTTNKEELNHCPSKTKATCTDFNFHFSSPLPPTSHINAWKGRQMRQFQKDLTEWVLLKAGKRDPKTSTLVKSLIKKKLKSSSKLNAKSRRLTLPALPAAVAWTTRASLDPPRISGPSSPFQQGK